MAYIISRTIYTPAKHSVDGKPHHRKNYYIGTESFGMFGIINWGKKEKAKRYSSEREAMQVAVKFGIECEVIEVKR